MKHFAEKLRAIATEVCLVRLKHGTVVLSGGIFGGPWRHLTNARLSVRGLTVYPSDV
jgi:hypothetical protein